MKSTAFPNVASIKVCLSVVSSVKLIEDESGCYSSVLIDFFICHNRNKLRLCLKDFYKMIQSLLCLLNFVLVFGIVLFTDTYFLKKG